MKTTSSKQLTLFDTQNFEYFFTISPVKRVTHNVSSIKQQLNEVIPIAEKDLYSVPHISLLKLEYTDNDHFILSLFKQALMYTRRFQIELNGMSYFDNKNKKTVYLNIANPEPIISLQTMLLSAFRFRQRDFIPHLTIARSISESDFRTVKNLLPDYKDSFWCNKITVLKKAIGEQSAHLKYTRIYEALLN